jgi:hypothetical protein
MRKAVGLGAALVALFAWWNLPRESAGVSEIVETKKAPPRAGAAVIALPLRRMVPAQRAQAASADPKSSPPAEARLSGVAGNDDPGPGELILRYEGRSGRLSPNARPEDAEVTTKIASPGPSPSLVIWVPSLRVQAGAEVVVHAALVDEAGAAVAAESMVAIIARHGAAPGPELPMQRVAAADHQFELRLRAPAEPAMFDYLVHARGTFHGEAFDRAAGGAFHVNAAGARLDVAAARVEKRGGDLALLVPAHVDQTATYWMYAELWAGPGGTQPVAFARERFERTPAGDRVLSISFGGGIIRAAGIDGPYVVRNLRFQQVDAFPPQEEDPVAALSPTAAYSAHDFE